MMLHQIFFYLTIILLPTQLGLHFWPEWALVLGRRLDYLSPTIFLTDITIFLTVLCWSIEKIRNHYSDLHELLGKKFHAHIPKHVWARGAIVLFFGFFVSLNILFAFSPLIALYKWIKIIEFGLFGLYIIKTKPSLSRSIGCLSVGVLYSSCIAILQFISQQSLGGPLWVLGERTFSSITPGIAKIQILPFSFFLNFYELRSMNYELIRPYATFPHPNVLGGFLALTLPFIIDQYLTNKNNSHRFISPSPYLHIYYLLVISLGIITLILTFSRTAWVAFILFMVLLHITDYSKRRISYPLSFAYGIGILILSFFIGNLFLPYFQKLTPTSESVFVRNDLNLAALSMVMPNDKIINHNSLHLPILSSNRLPILSLFTGVGLGNFLVELPKIYPHRDIFFLQPVHNIYLFVLSETGLIGFMIFLWSIYKGLWRKKLFIIHYSLFIILLIGLVDHYPLTLQQGQLLLTMLISFALFTYP